MTLSFLAASIFIMFMLVAAFYDLFTMTIPNELNAAIALLFFAVAYIADFSLFEVITHTSLAVGVLIAGFLMFVLGWIQGGDAKLAAAVTLWMGAEQSLAWFVYMGLIGGVLTLLILSIRHMPLPVFLLKYEWISRLHDPKSGVPYGIAIASGAILAYPESRIFINLLH